MEGREETCRSIIDVLSSRIQEDSERAGSNYLPAVASFMQPLPRHRRVITRVYLRKSENIPGEKRKAGRVRVIVRDYFAVDSLIGKQLITGQENRYKILYPVASPPFFFHRFFLRISRFALSVSQFLPILLLYFVPSVSIVDFSSRTIHFSFFFCPFQPFFFVRT